MSRSAQIPLVLLAASLALGACRQQSEPDRNLVENKQPSAPSVPTPEPPIDRAALLAAISQAASATAAGMDYPEALRRLDGRDFEFRIRFGCRGPATRLSQEWLGWSYDAEDRTLRVRARPTISIDEPLVATLGGEGFESVEGFWIPRPWLLQPVCPAAAAVEAPAESPGSTDTDEPNPSSEGEQSDEPVPTGPRIGIAQFFTSSDPRTRRRDMRPYEAVKTMPEGSPISSQGFDLVLTGRLRALPGRGVIACSATNAQSPPECIVSAIFQRVWIEQPDPRQVIAEWGGG